MRGEAPLPPDRHHDNIPRIAAEARRVEVATSRLRRRRPRRWWWRWWHAQLGSRRDGGEFPRYPRTRPCRRARNLWGRPSFSSFFVNILVLSIPIYLFPDFRPGSVKSAAIDTLIMLTAIVVAALLAHVVLDMIRRFMLMRVAVDFESGSARPVLASAAKAAQGRLDSRVPGAARSPADPLLPHRRRAAQHPRCRRHQSICW